MTERTWLADQFEEHRPRLHRIAYRMLGSASEADDAVQDAWLRLSRADAAGIEHLAGWLTTVVGRACLDLLRSRTSRREQPFSSLPAAAIAGWEDPLDPEHEVLLGDSIGIALLVVLETLTPVERVAFVLHDMFGIPFDEIGPIVGRSSAAARQLASRARRRVRGASIPDSDLERQREIVDAFLAAAHDGDFEALLAVLDPGVVFRADAAAVGAGAIAEIHGALAVATRATTAARSAGRTAGAQLALVNGAAGAVSVRDGKPSAIFAFTIRNGKIVEIELYADSARVSQTAVVVLEPRPESAS